MRRLPSLLSTACLVILLLLTVEPRSAHACICFRRAPAEKFLPVAAVFSGRVLEVVGPPTSREGNTIRLLPPRVVVARFTVERVWKGSLGQEVLVTTGVHDCAYSFEVGREYLVWAYPPAEDPEDQVAGALAADYGICGLSRPGPLGEQDEDIRVLGSLNRLPLVLAGAVLAGGIIGVLSTLRYRRLQRGAAGVTNAQRVERTDGDAPG